jgi:hypothetical protein
MARGLGTRSRFLVAYLVLGAAVGTGIGVFIVLLQRPGPKPPPPCSSSSWATSPLETSSSPRGRQTFSAASTVLVIGANRALQQSHCRS